MTLVDAMRILIRICLMPFVSMFKSSSRENMYIIEKISPLLLLLPPFAYGAGYLNGRKVRTMIHSSIAESNKKRIRKERIQKKKRRNTVIRNHEPEQLN